MAKKGTPVYARLHDHGLTVSQLNAVDLLVAGKTDTETGELLGLHRTTVTKWRLYSPEFQATLNVRRAELWGAAAAAARLQALIPKALDAIGEAMACAGPYDRAEVARNLLKLVGLPPLPAGGPTDPTDIVRDRVLARRAQAARDDDEDDFAADGSTMQQSTVRVRAELDALAAAPTSTAGGIEG
jgi:hypothetical protein